MERGQPCRSENGAEIVTLSATIPILTLDVRAQPPQTRESMSFASCRQFDSGDSGEVLKARALTGVELCLEGSYYSAAAPGC